MRILIVDDHPVIIAGCVAMFAAEEDIHVLDARDAARGFELYREQKPDICIVDIAMPGGSGLDLTQRILAQDPNAKIIIFSMNDDPIFASRAMSLGAKGYVTKNDNPYLLLEAVHKVSRGGKYMMPRMAEALAVEGVGQKGDIWSALNEREREILRLLGEGLQVKEIADRMGVSYKTIANSCSIIKNKLGLRSTNELSQKAYEYKSMV